MPGNPRAATVEDWDERTHEIVPDSQQVANTGAKVSSRLDHRFPEPLIDGASDSGYSSRTAATVNSTQSGPSGGKSPPTVLKQVAPKSDLTRKSSRRDRKDKERAARPDETMQMGAYPGPGYIQPRAPRSPSKPRRRDSYLRQPDVYYEGNHTQYHPSTPVDSRPMEFPSHQPYYGRPPMPDYHVPQQPVGYPMEEYHTSRSGRPPSAYAPVYHSDRAVGWPAAPSRGYGPPPQPQQQYHHFEHGPPPVSSAWHQGSYSSSPYGPQHNFPSEYYGQDYPYQRERSESREPSRRRNSMYGIPPAPPTEPEVFPDFEEDVEQYYARQPREKARGRGTIKPSQDYFDEDAAKMPPPPPPAPRSRNAPQIHQAKRPEARKVHSAAPAVPTQRRSSKALDMGDIRQALPELDYPTRRVSREVALPERSQSQSLRSSRRSNSYHDNPRGARIAVASSGRRRPESLYYDVDERPESPAAMEDRVGEAERYQAVTAGRSTAQVPLSQETLMSKVGNGFGSDNGSQKSRSNSSRGSATKTEKEAQNMTLNMNGMTIAFAEESLAGKSISIRTGDQGAMQFNITDGTTRRPKAYVQGSSYSDNTHTGGSSRRVLEDGRRARDRDDRRSERSVHQSTGHRSSRSGYARRYQI